eukprot:1251391-Amphidinium_carterae.1
MRGKQAPPKKANKHQFQYKLNYRQVQVKWELREGIFYSDTAIGKNSPDSNSSALAASIDKLYRCDGQHGKEKVVFVVCYLMCWNEFNPIAQKVPLALAESVLTVCILWSQVLETHVTQACLGNDFYCLQGNLKFDVRLGSLKHEVADVFRDSPRSDGSQTGWEDAWSQATAR